MDGFVRGWRRRALVLPVALVFAICTTGVAMAANPSSGTISQSNGSVGYFGATNPNMLQPNDTNPITGEPLTSFGTPCPSQTMDMTNSVCEHFTVTFQVSGTATTCVTFPAGTLNDNFLDIYVVDITNGEANGTLVTSTFDQGFNPQPTGQFSTAGEALLQQCISFPATAGQTFELLINEVFPGEPIGTQATCTNPPADATECVQGIVSIGPTGSSAGTTSPSGFRFSGSGQALDNSQLGLNLNCTPVSGTSCSQTNVTKGNVRFKMATTNTTCSFQAKGADTLKMMQTGTRTEPNGKVDPTGNVDATGHGTYRLNQNGDPPGWYSLHGEDHGDDSNGGGTLDSYTITIYADSGMTQPVCQGSGNLVKGNFEFRLLK
jgi:hypothetical protein